MADPIAERIRKVGGSTLRSIGHISRLQRIKDNDAEYVDPLDMLAELREDNKTLAARLRELHEVCDEHHDIASASLIENWIDETERRTWFLFEASRRGDATGGTSPTHGWSNRFWCICGRPLTIPVAAKEPRQKRR